MATPLLDLCSKIGNSQLADNPTQTYTDQINNMIDDMIGDKEITQQVGNILKTKKPRTPNIYFLPKIHKQKTPPPGRPIVSANGCPTEKISAFVDIFLNPIVPNSEHYVKDTTDFVNKIDTVGKVHAHSIVGTLDVTSLYTNIPNEEGIQTIESILEKERLPTLNPRNGTLIKLLRTVLTKNNFMFNGQNYLQIGGTAMGTRVAPSYDNLYMRALETKILENYHLKPRVWYRYIDDIFFIWDHGPTELTNWLKYLNGTNDTIKFTSEHSSEKINFLDTLVKKDIDNNLYTDLYIKPTDAHNYLKFDSSHPPHCKTSLPYSQLLRIKRICTKSNDFTKHAKEMKQHFIKWGIPPKSSQKAFTNVTKKPEQIS